MSILSRYTIVYYIDGLEYTILAYESILYLCGFSGRRVLALSEGRSTEAGQRQQGVALRAGDVRLEPADGVVCVVQTAGLEYLAVVAPGHRDVAQGALVGVRPEKTGFAGRCSR